jgi:hypothetical protein
MPPLCGCKFLACSCRGYPEFAAVLKVNRVLLRRRQMMRAWAVRYAAMRKAGL